MLSLSVYAFSRFMLAERKGQNYSLRQRQVRLLAESGVEYLRIMLMKEQSVISELGGLYDNETEFKGHIITDGTIPMSGQNAGFSRGIQGEPDPQDIGSFSVISSAMSDDDLLTGEYYRYGLEDESAKASLRWIMQTEIQSPGTGKAMLMRLPGVTDEIADSILDWLDEDSEPRENGAEDDYYAGLDPPYYTRNGLPDSLDELLLVRGVTPKLLYGNDWNRNGLIDLGEPSESSLEEFDVSDGSLNLGLISYLTLDSRESNTTSEGLEKINVNMDDLEQLRELLTERFENEDWVNYIISYRQQQPSSSSGSAASSSILSGLAGGSSGSSSSGTKINSLLDLVQTDAAQTGAQALNQTGANQTQTINSPFSNDPAEMNEYMPQLYDNLAISDTPVSGRININQAPRTVLELLLNRDDDLSASVAALGTATDTASQAEAVLGSGSANSGTTALSSVDAEAIVEGILAERIRSPLESDPVEMNYPFWVYTHGIVTDLETMKKLEPYFCCRGSVYKANVIGRFDEQSPVVRLEVWLDASEAGKPAKIIRIRELTELGAGYSAEVLGADQYSRQQNVQ
ncbi:general secretion pathway protein GspK [Planctomycetales bacterium]|nr:general secretion pathway protein GspK [Planctomycetales bacterium]